MFRKWKRWGRTGLSYYALVGCQGTSYAQPARPVRWRRRRCVRMTGGLLFLVHRGNPEALRYHPQYRLIVRVTVQTGALPATQAPQRVYTRSEQPHLHAIPYLIGGAVAGRLRPIIPPKAPQELASLRPHRVERPIGARGSEMNAREALQANVSLLAGGLSETSETSELFARIIHANNSPRFPGRTSHFTFLLVARPAPNDGAGEDGVHLQGAGGGARSSLRPCAASYAGGPPAYRVHHALRKRRAAAAGEPLHQLYAEREHALPPPQPSCCSLRLRRAPPRCS